MLMQSLIQGMQSSVMQMIWECSTLYMWGQLTPKKSKMYENWVYMSEWVGFVGGYNREMKASRKQCTQQ